MRNCSVCMLLTLLLAAAEGHQALLAEEWGDLSLRLVCDGEPPKAPGGRPNEVVVNPANRGIAHVLLYLRPAPGTTDAVHPDWDAKKLDKLTMTLERDRFDPPLRVVFTGQIFELVNKSRQDAQLSSEVFAMDVLLADGATHERRFKAVDSTAMPISNRMGEGQSGYVFISEHPFAAASDVDGNLRIKDLPVGKHTFIVWHARIGYVKGATRGGKQVAWTLGQMKVEIASGENDLGEFLLDPKIFK